MDFRTYDDFWPFYLSQHSKPSTRIWHFIGTACVLLCLVLSIVLKNGWFLLAAPVLGYGLAWFSHFFIEGNKPATFGHPLWSLRADFRMFWLRLTGKMEEELNRIRGNSAAR
jgi:hypothetical protein